MDSELSVRDALTPEYVGVSESDSVLGAVRLMRDERIGSVLVMRGANPVGIMTEWDVLGVVSSERDPDTTTIEEVMSTPVITIGVERSLSDAAGIMARENIRNLVVESDGEVVGLLTQRDVISVAGSFQAATAPASGERAVETAVTGSIDPRAAEEREVVPNGGDEYSTQGVCEACGSLADALWEANGQVVCSDCRTV
ncbi:CBS domain-containing protein [Halobacteria archaeon AArc-dxtr1]|nr:CBS domain-containing protein [Halobacteria archaeon AArc-dxtr1]